MDSNSLASEPPSGKSNRTSTAEKYSQDTGLEQTGASPMSAKLDPTTSDPLTSCAGDLPASLRLWLESVKAAVTNDGYGARRCGSLESFSPESASSRTQLDLFRSTEEEPSTELSRRLPRSGMLSRGIVYELPTLGRLIGGNGSSSLAWPTPDAAVFNDGQTVEAWEERHERELAKGYNGNGGGTPLAMAVRLWPTASATDGKTMSKPGQRRGQLADAMWPTATAGDGKSSGSRNLEGSNAHAGTSLTDAVSRPDRAWTTPRAEGFDAGRHRGKADSLHSQIKEQWATPTASENSNRTQKMAPSHGTTHGVVLGGQVGGKLSPNWVETLMGFPVEWTSTHRQKKKPWDDQWPGWPAPPGQEQYPYEPPRVIKACPNRPARLKALGNAVVPQVACLVGYIVKEIT